MTDGEQEPSAGSAKAAEAKKEDSMRLTCVLCGVLAVLFLAAPGFAGESGKFMKSAQGCLVWDPFPVEGETVSWDGACGNGYANGPGVLRWTFPGGWSENKALLKDGKIVGEIVSFKDALGSKLVFGKDGRGSGTYLYKNKDGLNKESGEFVYQVDNGNVSYDLDGKCSQEWGNGAWFKGICVRGWRSKGSMRFADGDTYEGAFIWKNLDTYPRPEGLTRYQIEKRENEARQARASQSSGAGGADCDLWYTQCKDYCGFKSSEGFLNEKDTCEVTCIMVKDYCREGKKKEMIANFCEAKCPNPLKDSCYGDCLTDMNY